MRANDERGKIALELSPNERGGEESLLTPQRKEKRQAKGVGGESKLNSSCKKEGATLFLPRKKKRGRKRELKGRGDACLTRGGHGERGLRGGRVCYHQARKKKNGLSVSVGRKGGKGFA